jgi:hypothetical protein
MSGAAARSKVRARVFKSETPYAGADYAALHKSIPKFGGLIAKIRMITLIRG